MVSLLVTSLVSVLVMRKSLFLGCDLMWFEVQS